MPLKMIKTLIVSFGKYTKFLILSCVFVTLEVLFDILLPRYMGKLIDFGIESGSIANTVHYGLILVAFAAAATVTGNCPAHVIVDQIQHKGY